MLEIKKRIEKLKAQSAHGQKIDRVELAKVILAKINLFEEYFRNYERRDDFPPKEEVVRMRRELEKIIKEEEAK